MTRDALMLALVREKLKTVVGGVTLEKVGENNGRLELESHISAEAMDALMEISMMLDPPAWTQWH